VKIITPATREEWLKLRTEDITSTDAAALFNISPYSTRFELWHTKKRGEINEIKENVRMTWGNRLQDSIAAGFAADTQLTVRKMTEYIRMDDLRAGSSFDFSIETEPLGILEIKNVDRSIYNQQWTETEAPLHIEIQVQHQLMVTGREYAYIVAMVGGNEIHAIKRTRDEAVISRIREEVVKFWASIEANTPPPPNFEADAEFISKLYGYAEPEKLFDARNNARITELAAINKTLKNEIKEREAKCDAIKAEILTIIGDAEKVLGDGWTITAGVVGECPVSYIRQEYRNFRFNWSKAKKGA
jgi:putative phage-type endonuclease